MADIVSFDEVVGSHDAHARFYCEDDAVVSYDIVSCCGVVRGPGFEENSVESDIVDIVARDLITHASNPNTRTIDPVVDSLRYFEPSDSNVICGDGEAFRDHAALRLISNRTAGRPGGPDLNALVVRARGDQNRIAGAHDVCGFLDGFPGIRGAS